MMQHPRRSSQDWLELINSCRTSGMTITAWCQANTVPKGSYEPAVKRLVKQGLLATPERNNPSPRQRVICISDMERSKKYPIPQDGRAENPSRQLGKKAFSPGNPQAVRFVKMPAAASSRFARPCFPLYNKGRKEAGSMDPEGLREQNQLLQEMLEQQKAYIEMQEKRIAEKDAAIADLRRLADGLQPLKANLLETLAELRRQFFGAASEKTEGPKPPEGGGGDPPKTTVKAHSRGPGNQKPPAQSSMQPFRYGKYRSRSPRKDAGAPAAMEKWKPLVTLKCGKNFGSPPPKWGASDTCRRRPSARNAGKTAVGPLQKHLPQRP